MQRYIFISYSRNEKETALALKRKLEAYKYPKKLVAFPDTMPPHETHLRSVFVDVENLSVGTNSFMESLEEELKGARFLIVLCSKSSARTDSICHWEIETFLKYHNEDHILPVVLDGFKPDSDGKNVIPKELIPIIKKRNVPAWKRAEKATSPANTNSFFHIVEFLIKVDAAILHNRHALLRRKLIIRRCCIIICVLLTIVGLLSYGLYKSVEAAENARRLAQRESEAAENAERLVLTEKQRVDFERRIYPYSIVTNYYKNFILKLERYITSSETNIDNENPSPTAAKAYMFIKIPNENNQDAYDLLSERDVDRLSNILTPLCRDGKWKTKTVTYQTPNESKITDTTRIIPPVEIENTLFFIDGASTVHSIKQVIDLLTKEPNDFYDHSDIPKLTNIFLSKFKECLRAEQKKHNPESEKGKPHVIEIKFIDNEQDIINIYNNCLEQQNHNKTKYQGSTK